MEKIGSQDITILDNNCTTLGIPKSLLMENAGCQATECILKEYQLTPEKIIGILCGTGNNGGDGFVIARHLASRGYHVKVVLVGDPAKIRTEEAKLNWNVLNHLIYSVKIFQLPDSALILSAESFLSGISLVLDCLLGTGVQGPIREPIRTAIELINKMTCSKVSIDVPSGMDPNTGLVSDKAVNCDFLITFHQDKHGLSKILHKNIVSIGIPPEASLFVGDGDLMAHFPQRKKANFKGQFGKILVIGGSSSYSGAPSFAAMAALELGVDLCIVLVPKSISVVVRTYSPNLILREGSDSILTPNDIPLAKELIKWADSVLIGPGMGLDPQTGQFFQEIITYLSNLKKPTVVDADGLKHLGNLFKAKISLSDMFPIIMTPHMGELHALIDFEQLPAYDNFTDRGIQLCSFVKKFTGGVILLKGVYDFIADSTSYRVNLTGCPEMAVGGTGDVLAGIVVALLGLSLIPFHACCLGAYLNGLLGEYSRDQHGHRILATDLVSNIRLILKEKGL